MDRLGNAYTGVTFDSRDGVFVLVATQDASSDDIDHVIAYFRLEGRLRVQRERFNAGDLRAVVNSLTDEYRDMIQAGDLTVGYAADHVEINLAGRVSDHQRQAIVEASNRVRAEHNSPPVDVERSAHSSLITTAGIACSFPYCDTWIGGPRWHNGYWDCTTGFYVGWFGSPYPYVLTAGHCMHGVPYSSPVWTRTHAGGPTIGTGITGQSYWGNTTPTGTIRDAGILGIGLGLWSMWPGYFNWSSGGLSPLHDYYTTHVGTNIWMCLNGATSWSTCGLTGAVTSYVASSGGGTTRYLYDMQQVIGTCASQGDSGGPVTLASYEKAMGVFSTANPINQCGNTMWVTPIWDAINNWGIMVHVQ